MTCSFFSQERIGYIINVVYEQICATTPFHCSLWIQIHYFLETHELVSWMKGEDSSIHSISIDASGRYALTSSNSVAQLWDLDTFSRKRTLNGAQTVGIQQVCSRLLLVNLVSLTFEAINYWWSTWWAHTYAY